jgi:hypothetical protein
MTSKASPPLPPAAALRDDDTIFEYVAEDASEAAGPEGEAGRGGEGAAAAAAAAAAPKIVLDAPSLELLKGSKVDYTRELIGSQFKIVDNPLATSSCGCGTSFDIKA